MAVLMVEQNVRMALLLAEYGRTHWRSVKATCRNTPPAKSLAHYVGPITGMLGVSALMAAVEEIVLECVPEEDVMRLRVGYQIIASAAVADRALVKLSHVARSYARRHKMRFVDVTRN
jgi:hypothetical protein